ncbi:MAG: AI-2E family transporter [Succinivibrionaceae bacterium]
MIKFFKAWYYHHLSHPAAAVLILQFLAIFLSIYYFSNILAPLIAALVLSFMLEKPTNFLIKHHANRFSASSVVISSFVVICISLVIMIVPPTINQLSKFANTITLSINNYSKSETKILNVENYNIPQKENLKNNVDFNTPSDHNNSSNNNNLSKKEETQDITVQWLINKLEILKQKLPESYQKIISSEQLNKSVSYISNIIKDWISPFLKTQIAPMLVDILNILIYIVIVPIFSFYMLNDKEYFLNLTKKYLAPYNEVSDFWSNMNNDITQYLNGKIIHILVISTINVISFGLLNLNYALLLGIGVGLSVVIPYVGALIITIPIVAIGIIQFGLSSDLLWLLIVYTVIQLIDAYVITPKLFSTTLNLNPFFILVAIVIFGGIWGFWGVVLAIPLATFVKNVITHWPSIYK